MFVGESCSLRLCPHCMSHPLAKLQYRQSVLPDSKRERKREGSPSIISAVGGGRELGSSYVNVPVIFQGKHVSVQFPAALNPRCWCNIFFNITTKWPCRSWWFLMNPDDSWEWQVGIQCSPTLFSCKVFSFSGSWGRRDGLSPWTKPSDFILCPLNIALLRTSD